jgi:energy-coupling factor transport system permease protein
MATRLRQSFGRYVSRESVMHGLDPSVKVAVFLMLIVSILLCGGWPATGIVAALLVALCAASGVSLAFYLGGLKYFTWMFALSFAINLLFPRNPAQHALSPGALNTAGVFSARLALMILAGTLFTVTTAPHEIGDSLLAFAGLRGRAGRKVADLAAILSISLRFIPVMFEEAERIRTAQMLRGQKARGLSGRVRAVVNLIAPLFQASLRKAAVLGFALESRCYGYMVPKGAGMRVGRSEWLMLALSAACMASLLVIRAVKL